MRRKPVRVQLGIKVDRRLWKQIKMKAVSNDCSATALVEEAFRRYLDEEPEKNAETNQ